MKKSTGFLVFAILLASLSFGQNTLLSIYGYVLDEASGAGLSNQIVTAEVMSGGMVEVFDMATGSSGFYGDSVPVFSQGTVTLSAIDCIGNVHVYTENFSPEDLTINHDFIICADSLPMGCTASFSYFLPPMGGNLVTFSNYSSGSPTGWLWDFGDGTTSTEWEPVHEFGDAGIYPVCLTIWSDSISCNDTYCEDILISNSGGGECENMFWFDSFDGYTFTFNGEGMPPASAFFWDFGDGSTGSGQTVQHTYSPGNTGPVIVNLTTYHSVAGTADSCVAASTQVVIVGDSLTGCENFFVYFPVGDFSFQFTGESFPYPADSYFWDFGDGTTGMGQEVLHTFDPAMGEMFIVTLTTVGYDPATGDSCVGTSAQEIITGGNPGDCYNLFWYETGDDYSVSFFGESFPFPADFYHWDFGDGSTESGQNVTHTFDPSGGTIFQVCLTTFISGPNGDSCAATSCQDIQLWGQPGVEVTGTVYAGGEPAGVVLVGLFSADPNTIYYEFTLTQDGSGMYFFEDIPEGDYYLFATPTPQSSWFYDYFPTYYGDAIFWFDSEMIGFGEPANPYDIHLLPITGAAAGPCFISGHVNLEDGKEGPGENIAIMLMDGDENAMNYTYTGENGLFSFSDLAFGTYKLKVEMPGVNSEIAYVELGEENTSAEITFFVNNSYAYLGMGGQLMPLSLVGDVFPNPVGAVAKMDLVVTEKADLIIQLISQTGQVLREFSAAYEQGRHQLEIETSSLNAGIYIIQLIGDSGYSSSRKFIK